MGKENQTHEGSYLVRDKKNTPIIMTSGRDKKNTPETSKIYETSKTYECTKIYEWDKKNTPELLRDNNLLHLQRIAPVITTKTRAMPKSTENATPAQQIATASSDEELMAMAMNLEKVERLKKVQEKRISEEEKRNKKKKEVERQHRLQLDSEEDYDILQAALALEEKEQAALVHPRPEDVHQGDQDEGGALEAVCTVDGAVCTTTDMALCLQTTATATALQHLSLGDVNVFIHGNQEELDRPGRGAGAQVDQGAGQALYQHQRQAALPGEGVDNTEQKEEQKLPAPHLSPSSPSSSPPRSPSPTGQQTPARVMLTPVWERKRRQRLSSSAPGSRKRHQPRPSSSRHPMPQGTTGTPAKDPGTPKLQTRATPRPFPPQLGVISDPINPSLPAHTASQLHQPAQMTFGGKHMERGTN